MRASGSKRTNIHPRLMKVQGVEAGASSDVVDGQAGRDQTDHPRRQVIGQRVVPDAIVEPRVYAPQESMERSRLNR